MNAKQDMPRVICHILQSLDGNIDGAFFGAAEAQPTLGEYARIRAEYDCDAIISGATTAAEIYAHGYIDKLPSAGASIQRTDHKAGASDHYAVIIDGAGTLDWRSAFVSRGGREMRVITILQEDVSDEYLALLKDAGISYIFAGHDRLDLKLALQKLSAQYGIKTLLLSGGGVVDWAFLNEGLIDEISIVVAPVVDGGTGKATAFDMSQFAQGAPVGLKLIESNPLTGGALHLRYEPVMRD